MDRLGQIGLNWPDGARSVKIGQPTEENCHRMEGGGPSWAKLARRYGERWAKTHFSQTVWAKTRLSETVRGKRRLSQTVHTNQQPGRIGRMPKSPARSSLMATCPTLLGLNPTESRTVCLNSHKLCTYFLIGLFLRTVGLKASKCVVITQAGHRTLPPCVRNAYFCPNMCLFLRFSPCCRKGVHREGDKGGG